VVSDVAGTILEANSAAARLLGVPKEELAGRRFSDFVVPADRETFLRDLQLLRAKVSSRREAWPVVLKPADRPAIPVELTVDAEFDAARTLRGLRWLIRDVTESRRAEEQRAQFLLGRAEAEAARRVAFLSDASALLAGPLDDDAKLANVARLAVPYLADWCFVHVTDGEGRPLQVEIAFSDPAHGELAERLRRHFLQMRPAAGTLPFWQRFAKAMVLQSPGELWQGSQADPGTDAFLQRIGARSIIVVPLVTAGAKLGALTLISAASGRRYTDEELTLAQDLGRRCALAMENARLYREVIRERDIAATASRAKDEFLAVLSHELRNPLMPVVGWTRILSNHSEIRNDPVLAEGVRALERNAQTLNRLVEDCLDLARISERKIAMDRVAVDLNRILLVSAESVREKAESKQIKLVLELCPGAIWVMGDPARLQQVMMNLLVNAVKYTLSGGTIFLRSGYRDGSAELEVRDTGVGIRPQALDLIFQPFHREPGFESEAGLGLGLALARQIVDLHGGQITAESDGPGTGSVFRVVLPLTAPPQPLSASAAAVPAPLEPRRQTRVLVVEDSRDVLFLLRTGLERMGYAVFEAQDGETALALAGADPPDVIVSDIKMPGVDGYELIRRLRADPRLRHIPVVALTGFGQKADVERALAVGFQACLTKPAEMEDLAALLERLTQNGEDQPGGVSDAN
jgi:PAS domain S-box-containing protein